MRGSHSSLPEHRVVRSDHLAQVMPGLLLPPRIRVAALSAPQGEMVGDALALQERAELYGLRDAAVFVRATSHDDREVRVPAYTIELGAPQVREERKRIVEVEVLVALA